ncbi:MAG: transporter substrate-binding domain-containing protein [Desulfarculaceae bacterium]|nr:transporter substrate-binding domain-containing protein [Desulfarculaceae bacterium]MCF8071507.1 transporter substrate-binding domain-containing protein [Desulfarculaceae bacterium]MCF8102322.1 transporter substrate-binding domain-containing protein [Desulfarculaceae bacterium]MCF8114786.1 transporter substrate-binding domain-containing protein [Desulfarculaceae bacterium]
MENAYKWLLKGRLDAVVYARPNLRYFANTGGKGRVQVAGRVFAPQDHGMATPQGSPLREEINRILLAISKDGRLDKDTQQVVRRGQVSPGAGPALWEGRFRGIAALAPGARRPAGRARSCGRNPGGGR